VNYEAVPWLKDPTNMHWSPSNQSKNQWKKNSINLDLSKGSTVSMALDCLDQLKDILEGVAEEKKDYKEEIMYLKSEIKTLKSNMGARPRQVYKSSSKDGFVHQERPHNEDVLWT